MICNCGRFLDDDWSTCPYCGLSIEKKPVSDALFKPTPEIENLININKNPISTRNLTILGVATIVGLFLLASYTQDWYAKTANLSYTSPVSEDEAPVETTEATATPTSEPTAQEQEPQITTGDGLVIALGMGESPQQIIARALGYYCESAPTNYKMWMANGSSGLFSAVNLKTGSAFYVQLSPGSRNATTVLTAYDDYAASEFARWGCPQEMTIEGKD